MGRGTVRWIAIAVIAAMVAFLAVGLVSGRGDEAGPPGRQEAVDGGAPAVATDSAALDGPHVILELCTGVACPRPSDAEQRRLQDEVASDPRVASARFVTSEQAYQLFLDRYGDDQELVEQVDPDTVPAEIQADLHRTDDVAAVVAEFEGHEAVATALDAREPVAEP